MDLQLIQIVCELMFLALVLASIEVGRYAHKTHSRISTVLSTYFFRVNLALSTLALLTYVLITLIFQQIFKFDHTDLIAKIVIGAGYFGVIPLYRVFLQKVKGDEPLSLTLVEAIKAKKHLIAKGHISKAAKSFVSKIKTDGRLKEFFREYLDYYTGYPAFNTATVEVDYAKALLIQYKSLKTKYDKESFIKNLLWQCYKEHGINYYSLPFVRSLTGS